MVDTVMKALGSTGKTIVVGTGVGVVIGWLLGRRQTSSPTIPTKK